DAENLTRTLLPSPGFGVKYDALGTSGVSTGTKAMAASNGCPAEARIPSLNDNVTVVARWNPLRRTLPLLDRTGDRRKNSVGVTTYKADRAHHDHQDHCQHHRVFRDVLSFIPLPQIADNICHLMSSMWNQAAVRPTVIPC